MLINFNGCFGYGTCVAKFVLKSLNFDQKQHCTNTDQDLLIDVNNDSDLLKWIITGDESWIYDNDVETKAQSFQ